MMYVDFRDRSKEMLVDTITSDIFIMMKKRDNRKRGRNNSFVLSGNQSLKGFTVRIVYSKISHVSLIALVFLCLFSHTAASEDFNNCKFELKSGSCSCSWDTKDKENTDFFVDGDYVASCIQKFQAIGGSSLIEKYQDLYKSTFTTDGWCLVKIKKMVSDTIHINITSETNGLKSIAVSNNVLTTCIHSTNTSIILEGGANTCTNAGTMSARTSEGLIAIAILVVENWFVKY